MKIYTRGGDDGTTALFGGGPDFRVYKHMPQIEAVGAIDEINAHLGFITQCGPCGFITQYGPCIREIQNVLFKIGSEIAAVHPDKLKIDLVSTGDIEKLEAEIDELEETLPELKNFILPGGCELASRLHIARAVARRAERACVALRAEWADYGFEVRDEVLGYLNRLSDLLFVMARHANHCEQVPEILWENK